MSAKRVPPDGYLTGRSELTAVLEILRLPTDERPDAWARHFATIHREAKKEVERIRAEEALQAMKTPFKRKLREPVEDPKRESASRALRRFGETQWLVHLMRSGDRWVAREPYLMIEVEGRSREDAIRLISELIQNYGLRDPNGALNAILGREEPEIVRLSM